MRVYIHRHYYESVMNKDQQKHSIHILKILLGVVVLWGGRDLQQGKYVHKHT